MRMLMHMHTHMHMHMRMLMLMHMHMRMLMHMHMHVHMHMLPARAGGGLVRPHGRLWLRAPGRYADRQVRRGRVVRPHAEAGTKYTIRLVSSMVDMVDERASE